jgi:hypothetical protein
MSPRKQRLDPADSARPDGSRIPSLREQLRPVELIGIAAVLSVFVGLVVLMATREPLLAVVFFGIAFIVVLVVLAMFVLGIKPDTAEQQDLAEQNGLAGDAGGGAEAGEDVRGAADGPASDRPSPHD